MHQVSNKVSGLVTELAAVDGFILTSVVGLLPNTQRRQSRGVTQLHVGCQEWKLWFGVFLDPDKLKFQTRMN